MSGRRKLEDRKHKKETGRKKARKKVTGRKDRIG